MIGTNCNVTLRIIPDRAYDGTYNKDDVIEVEASALIKNVKKIDRINPASQFIEADLGIIYSKEIDKEKTEVICNGKRYKIDEIKNSTLINPNWKILSLVSLNE
jgi:hypothetical protein